MPAKRTTGSIEWVGDPSDPKASDHWRCRVTIDGERVWWKIPGIPRTQRAKASKAALDLAAAARAGRLTAPPKRGARAAEALRVDGTPDADGYGVRLWSSEYPAHDLRMTTWAATEGEACARAWDALRSYLSSNGPACPSRPTRYAPIDAP